MNHACVRRGVRRQQLRHGHAGTGGDLPPGVARFDGVGGRVRRRTRGRRRRPGGEAHHIAGIQGTLCRCVVHFEQRTQADLRRLGDDGPRVAVGNEMAGQAGRGTRRSALAGRGGGNPGRHRGARGSDRGGKHDDRLDGDADGSHVCGVPHSAHANLNVARCAVHLTPSASGQSCICDAAARRSIRASASRDRCRARVPSG